MPQDVGYQIPEGVHIPPQESVPAPIPIPMDQGQREPGVPIPGGESAFYTQQLMTYMQQNNIPFSDGGINDALIALAQQGMIPHEFAQQMASELGGPSGTLTVGGLGGQEQIEGEMMDALSGGGLGK